MLIGRSSQASQFYARDAALPASAQSLGVDRSGKLDVDYLEKKIIPFLIEDLAIELKRKSDQFDFVARAHHMIPLRPIRTTGSPINIIRQRDRLPCIGMLCVPWSARLTSIICKLWCRN